ncbi:hypothetical protein [Actinomadura roseirufa]|uniref:hypothetical protein n=1 Tax=Actinomadura roseirufa TaxID=2094049 RepID=UPI0010414335|nr:hypothetical protein [Actinomadura roseirufa]
MNRRMTGRTIGAAAGLAVMVAGAPGALAAAPSWRVVKEVRDPARAVALRDVAAVGPRAAWAVGDDGRTPLLQRFNGSTWVKVAVPLRAADGTYLGTVDASSASDLWIFGRYGGHGLAARWDGARWRSHDLGGRTVTGAKVLGPRDVWVGAGTSAGHYDGRTWKFSGVGVTVRSVAASNTKDVWFAGQNGGSGAAIAHWDGKRYRRQSLPSIPAPSQLRDIVAFRPNNVWAVGSANGRPLILHWDGRKWSRTVLPRGDGFVAVTADGRGGLWAADSVWAGAVYHYAGGRWTPTALPNPPSRFLSVGALANVRGTTRVWGAGTYLDEDPSNSLTTGAIFTNRG